MFILFQLLSSAVRTRPGCSPTEPRLSNGEGPGLTTRRSKLLPNAPPHCCPWYEISPFRHLDWFAPRFAFPVLVDDQHILARGCVLLIYGPVNQPDNVRVLLVLATALE